MELLPFLGYVRKSTDENNRQLLSIEAQIFELKAYAKKEGLQLVDIFTESRTAKSPGRPVFNFMLSEIEKGKAQGIVAWHPDRLARNSVDGGRIVYLVDQGLIRDLRFPTFHFEASAHGKFMLNIAFSQSKYYVDSLSENVKRGSRQKLRNGMWPGWAPVGYVNDRNKRSVVVHPEKAALVRKAFEFYATGNFTLRGVRDAINSLGLVSQNHRLLTVSNYQRMFKNPFYYGLMRYKGELHEGTHDPIVSKRTFDEVQEVMKRKSKPKGPTLKPYLYRGLFRCAECGCFITTETQKGTNYLRCTKKVKACAQPYVRETAIALQIEEAIASVAVDPLTADVMIAALEEEQHQAQESAKTAMLTLKGEILRSDEKLDALLDMRLGQQVFEPEYLLKKQTLLQRKADLKVKLDSVTTAAANRLEPAIAFLSRLKEATVLLTQNKPEEKRDFLKMIGSNLRVGGKRLSVELKNPWKLMAEWNSFPRHNLSDSRQIAICPQLRSLMDKVRTHFAENPGG